MTTTRPRTKLAARESRQAAELFGIPPLRIELLRMLRDRPMCVSEIMSSTGWSRHGIQSHLDALGKLGCVTVTRRAVAWSDRPTRFYGVDRVGTEELAWAVFDSIAEPA